MDDQHFDDLVKRLTQARLSRFDAVRGLLASAVVGLTGATLAEKTAARKQAKGKHKRHGKGNPQRKGTGKAQGKGKGKIRAEAVTICHCPPGNPTNCETITVGDKAAQAHLAHHPLDRRGACPGQTTTTPAVTTTTQRATTTTPAVTTTTAFPACPRGQCQGGPNPVTCTTVGGCTCQGHGAHSFCGR